MLVFLFIIVIIVIIIIISAPCSDLSHRSDAEAIY